MNDRLNEMPAEGPPGGPAAKSRAAAQSSRLRMAELLLEVSRRMAAYDTLDEILTALVEVTTEELDAERGTLFLNDPETNELFSRVTKPVCSSMARLKRASA